MLVEKRMSSNTLTMGVLGSLALASCAAPLQLYEGPAKAPTEIATIRMKAGLGSTLLSVDERPGEPIGNVCFRMRSVVQLLPGKHKLEVALPAGVVELGMVAEAGVEYYVERVPGPQPGAQCLVVRRADGTPPPPESMACVLGYRPSVVLPENYPAGSSAGLKIDFPMGNLTLMTSATTSPVYLYKIDGQWGPNSRDVCFVYNSAWNNDVNLRLAPGPHVLEVSVTWGYTRSAKPVILRHEFQAGKNYIILSGKKANSPTGFAIVEI
jgi:hypothetical protein